MPDLPKISVVTVSFNQGDFIEKNITSVLEQNYPNFEHIVIDAGSTDGTLEILEKYHHLLWTSEPDRGQSDGLNKGFRKATGEIIAWLNSDDWYAPGIFHEIVPELAEYPVLLGAAQQTDRDGNPNDLVLNEQRSVYDLLRHWIPYNWLAQTSVFFRRDLLEEVRYAPGIYLDESLHFAMDLDLWIRFAERYPFSRRLNKTCSYFRVYDRNKTGERPIVGQRENARVARRNVRRMCRAEQTLSIIIPLHRLGNELGGTIESLIAQSCSDFEILFVDCNNEKDTQRVTRDMVYDLTERLPSLSFRYERSLGATLLEAFNEGARQAHSPLVTLLESGDRAHPDFVHEGIKTLHADTYAAALPLSGKDDLVRSLFSEQSKNIGFVELLQAPYFKPQLIIEKVFLQEFGGFIEPASEFLSLQHLLLNLILSGHRVSLHNAIGLEFLQSEETHKLDQVRLLRPYFVAHQFAQLARKHLSDPCNEHYLSIGVRPGWNEATIERAEQVLETLPERWYCFDGHTPEVDLENAVTQFPHFSTPHYLLALRRAQQGKEEEARELKETYRTLEENLRQNSEFWNLAGC